MNADQIFVASSSSGAIVAVGRSRPECEAAARVQGLTADRVDELPSRTSSRLLQIFGCTVALGAIGAFVADILSSPILLLLRSWWLLSVLGFLVGCGMFIVATRNLSTRVDAEQAEKAQLG